MGSWLDLLRLTARAKTGVTGNVLLSGAGFAWAAMATGLWLSITAFVFIGNGYAWPWQNQWVFAGCVLLLFWLALTALLAFLTYRERNKAKARAEAALAAERAALLDPSMLTAALEIGRAIGWRRVVSLAGVALLATGLAKEWFAHGDEPSPEDEEN
jgi:hypothetical protein